MKKTQKTQEKYLKNFEKNLQTLKCKNYEIKIKL